MCKNTFHIHPSFTQKHGKTPEVSPTPLSLSETISIPYRKNQFPAFPKI
ncbi:hypothetical protein ABID23_001342 [Bartonella silvatica]|uniref:Uncharacterized protein n=1 Tax=Bartonella silvatica TaxID=357760 RepID=A0ABV2HIE0_9HYPH